jgi:hypothetical protein
MMYCVPETETKSCIVWFQFTNNKDANRINNLEVALLRLEKHRRRCGD